MASGYALGTAGRLMWAGSDLKMTNQLEDSGVSIRRAPAIVAVVLASISWAPYVNIVAVPGTWVAGGIASGRIREGQREIAPSLAHVGGGRPRLSGFNAGVTIRF